jgi:hypothetical protein
MLEVVFMKRDPALDLYTAIGIAVVILVAELVYLWA